MGKIFVPLFFLIIAALTVGVYADMTVHFIDVGHGDAELIQSGDHFMLIDAGPGESADSLVSYLQDLGVSKLDVVVATHPHDDHIGGMEKIIDTFPIGLYVDNGKSSDLETYVNIMDKTQSKQIPYQSVKAGDIIPFVNDITIEVLNPSSLEGDSNTDSVVLKVTDNKQKFLFMGDAADGSGDLSAQVLKVTHHGSDMGTSSSFLNKVNPEVAVIEVGANNIYDFPAQATLNNLKSKGMKVYRTDLNGDIVIESNGETYSVKTEKNASPQVTPATVKVVTTPKYSSPSQTSISPRSTPKPVPTKVIPTPKYSAPSQTSSYVSAAPSSSGVCDCSGDKYNCGDFPLPGGVTAEECFNYCNFIGAGDIHRLDRDNNGYVCES